ncbi:MAG: hypothetical protein ACJ8C4_09365 [Gemmataceae bacterium]
MARKFEAIGRWWQRVTLDSWLFAFACWAWMFAMSASSFLDFNREIEKCGDRPEYMEIKAGYERLRAGELKELIAFGVLAAASLGFACRTWLKRARAKSTGDTSLTEGTPTETPGE